MISMISRAKHYFDDFRKEDFPEIMELWKVTGLGDPVRGDDATTIENCNAAGGEFITMKIRDTGELIGTSWLTNDGRRLFLHHFCIKPAYQGKGFGKVLGIRTMEIIREKKMQVKLEVHRDNVVARKLYENLGFFAFTDYSLYMIRDTGSNPKTLK